MAFGDKLEVRQTLTKLYISRCNTCIWEELNLKDLKDAHRILTRTNYICKYKEDLKRHRRELRGIENAQRAMANRGSRHPSTVK
jgi:hypothetical protein